MQHSLQSPTGMERRLKIAFMTSAVRIAATGGAVGVSTLRQPPGAREEDALLSDLTD